MTAVAVAATRREAILAHLADHPDLTESELRRVIGSGSHVGRLLQDMQAKAEVVFRPGRRPGQGGPVYLWRIAPPGTVPPPRRPVPAEVLASKRERDRRATAARRARIRPLFAGAPDLPDAACAGADPALFFPDRGDADTEARAVAICAGCPARSACYERAVQNGERSGIWGAVNFETKPPTRRWRHAQLAERTLAIMGAPEPQTGLEPSDLGRFEPSPYDLGITDDPEVSWAAFREPEPEAGQ